MPRPPHARDGAVVTVCWRCPGGGVTPLLTGRNVGHARASAVPGRYHHAVCISTIHDQTWPQIAGDLFYQASVKLFVVFAGAL